MRFRKLLCPTDFSEGARHALRTAIEMSDGEAELVLAHVWHPPYFYGPETTFPDALAADFRVDAERELERWTAEATKLGAKRVAPVFLVGAPWNEIVRLAEVDGADLIVMGTHGRTGLKHVLLGSVAEKVVRHAHCPVLVVRPVFAKAAAQP